MNKSRAALWPGSAEALARPPDRPPMALIHILLAAKLIERVCRNGKEGGSCFFLLRLACWMS